MGFAFAITGCAIIAVEPLEKPNSRTTRIATLSDSGPQLPMNDLPGRDLLFEAQTPLGFRVRVTRPYWEFIATIKHPVMAGREAVVKETLENPDEIRLSRSDPTVYLFYKSERIRRWVCAVAKCLDDEGFLITSYPTEVIKEGVRVWPK